ncbi:hypothetical protein EAL2_c10360 [Peptoclostridium acidaminophilum DSM 3953]|uniref:Zinc-ribbon domain-containing protein n=1 Tax=Peptoclostridium acidaminophilum DSM 3953 TaxID=1286171 RepID=W8T3I8_PEPAC|nr:zinc ribbon domain-containing protein [Peptoclostridium acidaminophilum]AHM56334.1 hypothetical protein EAL2_c10360 [Peptoclostridium acidaminophilum DSM 3953]
MFCTNCGSKLEPDSVFCSSCGEKVVGIETGEERQSHAESAAIASSKPKKASNNLVGFSPRISDPAFKKYLKNSNRWSLYFSLGIALIAVVGFYIAGEKGIDGMSNPESLYIGFGIGGMFVTIALFQIMGRKRSKTWDGKVIDKTVKNKAKEVKSGSSSYIKRYTEFTVFVRSDSGKKYVISVDDDDTLYNYFNVGDRLRHHGGLNSYEKYDKTGDDIIFCAACATLCDIKEDTCYRCKCPLLK